MVVRELDLMAGEVLDELKSGRLDFGPLAVLARDLRRLAAYLDERYPPATPQAREFLDDDLPF